jgi:hypothetical protein
MRDRPAFNKLAKAYRKAAPGAGMRRRELEPTGASEVHLFRRDLSTLAAAPRGPLIPNREQGSGPQSDSPTRRPRARDGLRPSGGTCRQAADELLRPFLGRVSGSHRKKLEQPAGSHLEPALLKEVKLSSSPGRAARQRCAVGFFNGSGQFTVASFQCLGFGSRKLKQLTTDNRQLALFMWKMPD